MEKGFGSFFKAKSLNVPSTYAWIREDEKSHIQCNYKLNKIYTILILYYILKYILNILILYNTHYYILYLLFYTNTIWLGARI